MSEHCLYERGSLEFFVTVILHFVFFKSQILHYNLGFNKVDLYSLKEITDIRSTKLKILTQLKPSGYFDLNYMIKVLMLNKVSRRNNKIAKIKNAFDKSGVEFIYKYPSNQNAKVLDEHYKFHYKTIL